MVTAKRPEEEYENLYGVPQYKKPSSDDEDILKYPEGSPTPEELAEMSESGLLGRASGGPFDYDDLENEEEEESQRDSELPEHLKRFFEEERRKESLRSPEKGPGKPGEGSAMKGGAKGGAVKQGEKALVRSPYFWAAVGIILLVLIIIILFIAPLFTGPEKGDVAQASEKPSIICLDPGHPAETEEGLSTGATGEYQLNWKVANELKAELEKRTYQVIMTKTSEEQSVRNKDRADICADGGAAFMYALHAEAGGPPHPYHIYPKDSRTKIQAISKEYAEKIQAKLMAKLKNDTEFKNGGTCMEDACTGVSNLGIYSEADKRELPASLIEMIKLDDKGNSILDIDEKRKRFVEGIADGIESVIPKTGGGLGKCPALVPTDPTSATATHITNYSDQPSSVYGPGAFANMDDYPNKSYSLERGGSINQHWGQPELISILQSVAGAYNKAHPDLKILMGDLSSKSGGPLDSHSSHQIGLDVDIYSLGPKSYLKEGNPGVYDRDLAIEVGKLLMDTKAIIYIFYNDDPVQTAVNNYAKEKSLPGVMQTEDGHYNHFHVRIDKMKYRKACGF